MSNPLRIIILNIISGCSLATLIILGVLYMSFDNAFVFTDTEERIYSADMAVLTQSGDKPVIEVFNGRTIS